MFKKYSSARVFSKLVTYVVIDDDIKLVRAVVEGSHVFLVRAVSQPGCRIITSRQVVYDLL